MKKQFKWSFKGWTLIVAALVMSISTATQADDHFHPLFDGKTLNGWTIHGGNATYTIEDGEIRGHSVKNTGNTFLATDQEYANFVLELDVLVDSELNSGIQIRSHIYDFDLVYEYANPKGETQSVGVPAGRFHGYQVEIDPSKRAWSGGIYDEGRRGWLAKVDGDDKQAAREAFKPGEWNHYRIEANGSEIKTWINGTPIVELQDNMTPSGRIALQVHGIGNSDELNGKTIRWKNIKLKDLNSKPESGVSYKGKEGPGKGKKVVLISGDEEYRSEEALPQLAKILAERHGFDTQVLFAIDPETGFVNPNVTSNIPGTEALDTADLLVLFTRFRTLPDEQMEPIDRYLTAGKPVIAIRTATHGFNHPGDSKWHHYANGYSGEKTEWKEGFGRLVLGECWYNHHGSHFHESTHGIVVDSEAKNPILRGVESGRYWASTDVYGVRLPLPGDSLPLILGQVTVRAGEYDANDRHFGMRPTDSVPNATQNSPMMPIVWTKSYQLPGGKVGHSLTSTAGASADLENEDVRLVFVNAAYVMTGLTDKLPETGADVTIVGDYEPTAFSGRSKDFWNSLQRTPEFYR